MFADHIEPTVAEVANARALSTPTPDTGERRPAAELLAETHAEADRLALLIGMLRERPRSPR